MWIFTLVIAFLVWYAAKAREQAEREFFTPTAEDLIQADRLYTLFKIYVPPKFEPSPSVPLLKLVACIFLLISVVLYIAA